MRLSLVVVVMLIAMSVGQEVIDLSRTLTEEMPYYPMVDHFKMIIQNGTMQDHWFQFDSISMGTHSGTHLDAPCHFSRGAWCVSNIPVHRLIAPAIVVDIRHQVGDNGDYRLTSDDLEEWESLYGRIPDGSVLLVLTGWGRYWDEPDKYIGSSDPRVMHFPGLSVEAAQWLVDNRLIYGLGMDTLSIDYGMAAIPICHTILAPKSIYNLENLANLDRLPATGALLYSMPLKIEGASGSPARVVALIGGSSTTRKPSLFSVLGFLLLLFNRNSIFLSSLLLASF